VKRALISVYDKSGIDDFAQKLVRNNYEIISSGGTAKHLSENGIKVTLVREITGTKEMLDGRVKTLHPHIFGGILAREQDGEELMKLGIGFFHMVVCDLYPFEDVVSKPDVDFENAIENIDIGGVSLIRAGAKNFERVIVISDTADFEWIAEKIEHDGVTFEERLSLAKKSFMYTTRYDSAIANFLSRQDGRDQTLPSTICIPIVKIADLRYGENPHQRGALYRELGQGTALPFEKHQGKKLSFINIIDMESAITIANSFAEVTAAIIKHTNPCGIGIGKDTLEAYQRALSTDSMSAFGGIIGLNRKVTEKTAMEIIKSFKEVVVAPSYDTGALEIFKKKKNLRIVQIDKQTYRTLDYRAFFGGWLIQETDTYEINENEWEFVSNRKPDESERNALRFAWKVVGFVKSNAIVLTDNTRTIGIGAGQMSRIDAAELAVKKAKQAGLDVKGTFLASDAFFPFRDSIDFAAKEAITAVIEPGGSKRDSEVIEAANEHNIVLVFTHRRHFRH